ncbi:hypothetical protein KCP69_09315 [Salmonella enterica subsp. enterica]|nr:hypothetical protein KCP69_09315 [Salmonella enterica subsp. enterica]
MMSVKIHRPSVTQTLMNKVQSHPRFCRRLIFCRSQKWKGEKIGVGSDRYYRQHD